MLEAVVPHTLHALAEVYPENAVEFLGLQGEAVLVRVSPQGVDLRHLTVMELLAEEHIIGTDIAYAAVVQLLSRSRHAQLFLQFPKRRRNVVHPRRDMSRAGNIVAPGVRRLMLRTLLQQHLHLPIPFSEYPHMSRPVANALQVRGLTVNGLARRLAVLVNNIKYLSHNCSFCRGHLYPCLRILFDITIIPQVGDKVNC